MSHALANSSFILLAIFCTAGCISRVESRPTSQSAKTGNAYSASLAAIDPTLHPCIVRLRHYSQFDSDEPIDSGFPTGYVFDILAPDDQKGRTLRLHYCDPPGGHRYFADVGKIYVLRLRFPLNEFQGTNMPSCCFLYQTTLLP